jgi:hypothetical protein
MKLQKILREAISKGALLAVFASFESAIQKTIKGDRR